MSEWIRVKDRLPRKVESVGYVFDGKDVRSDVYYPGFCGSWESENGIGWYTYEKNITHWMEIPKPPEKNERMD